MTNTELRTSQLWEDEGIVQPSSMVAQQNKKKKRKRFRGLAAQPSRKVIITTQQPANTSVTRVCVFVFLSDSSLVTHVRRAARLFLTHDRHPVRKRHPEICKPAACSFVRSFARPPAAVVSPPEATRLVLPQVSPPSLLLASTETRKQELTGVPRSNTGLIIIQYQGSIHRIPGTRGKKKGCDKSPSQAATCG